MLEFNDLYQSYAHEIYRFAYWLSGSSVEAEDITSETFIRAWINWSTIRTETLKAYLLTIARNVYLAQQRKQRKQIDLEEIQPDPQPGPEQRTEHRAELELAEQVLQSLPEIDRAAFVLRIQHELAYVEIARILQLSENVVRVKVHRVRKKMLIARTSRDTT